MNREYLMLFGQFIGAIVGVLSLVCLHHYWVPSYAWILYALVYVIAAGTLYCAINVLLDVSNFIGFLWASWSLGRKDH